MSEEEFMEQLFNDEDVPSDPEKLLEFSKMLYQLYLNADEDDPIRSKTSEINWEEFGAMLEEAQAADDEVKRTEANVREAEAKLKEAEENYKNYLRRFLPEN